MNVLVVDASVVLAFYLPAEPYKAQAMALLGEYVAGSVDLVAPALIRYEVLNALTRAERGLKPGQTLSPAEGLAVANAFDRLRLPEKSIHGLEPRILDIGQRYQRSAYDAAYLALAEQLGTRLITGDERFYNALHADFPQVMFVAGAETLRD